MTRRPGPGGTRRQAPGATSPDSSLDRSAKLPNLALPADLGRSLRLLDDAGLDRLMKAVIEEAGRRGLDTPDGSPGAGRGAKEPGPAKTPRTEAGASDRPVAVTPGQERLILAAFEAGLKPAAIAREFRLSRPTVQHVITGAQRDRRKTER